MSRELSTYEAMGGTYTEVDGVLYPNIVVSEEADVWIGKYGLLWIDYMKSKGKHRRTKKEILDEAGNIRKKCKVIKKGEVYERHLFTTKNELFKADGFLNEVKRLYTDLINVCAIKEEDKLQVFDRNGMYLATKKIGKNNPKAAEIEADNMERVRWNQAVDRALISGVAEDDILGVKREKISEEVKDSIELYGNNPSFLGDIIRLAIKALELLISKVLLSRRSIQCYEKAGLMMPSDKNKYGHLLYDIHAMHRAEKIKFMQELGFKLREIKEIIDAPSAVIKEALEQRISELEKETARLDQIIKEATEYIETLR